MTIGKEVFRLLLVGRKENLVDVTALCNPKDMMTCDDRYNDRVGLAHP